MSDVFDDVERLQRELREERNKAKRARAECKDLCAKLRAVREHIRNACEHEVEGPLADELNEALAATEGGE